jgi:hypothetical protein
MADRLHPYRCYFLDEAKHIRGFEAAQFLDDASAIRWADQLLSKGPPPASVELWCRDRLVQRRNAEDAIRPSAAPPEAGHPTS